MKARVCPTWTTPAGELGEGAAGSRYSLTCRHAHVPQYRAEQPSGPAPGTPPSLSRGGGGGAPAAFHAPPPIAIATRANLVGRAQLRRGGGGNAATSGVSRGAYRVGRPPPPRCRRSCFDVGNRDARGGNTKTLSKDCITSGWSSKERLRQRSLEKDAKHHSKGQGRLCRRSTALMSPDATWCVMVACPCIPSGSRRSPGVAVAPASLWVTDATKARELAGIT